MPLSGKIRPLRVKYEDDVRVNGYDLVLKNNCLRLWIVKLGARVRV